MEHAYSVFRDVRPKTFNELAHAHWAVVAREVKDWRDAFCWLTRKAKLPHLTRVEVHVVAHVREASKVPDVMAQAFAAKAALDGIVDAKVLSGDTPAHVVRISFETPVVGVKDGLELRLVDLAGFEGVA